MSHNLKRESRKRAPGAKVSSSDGNGVVGGHTLSSAAVTKGVTTSRTRQPPPPPASLPPPSEPKRDNTTLRHSVNNPFVLCSSTAPAPTLNMPFSPLLHMPAPKNMYPALQCSALGRNTEGSIPGVKARMLSLSSSSSLLPHTPPLSMEASAAAGMFLRQLRVTCAAFTGRASNDSGGGNGVAPGVSPESVCPMAGFNLYRQLYDLNRWLFPRSASVNGKPKVVKHAWEALFCKKKRSWRAFMTLLDSELVLADANVAAGLLTLLYNLLRATSRARRRGVVKLCSRLRLPHLCATIIDVYEGAFVDAFGGRDCSRFNPVRTGNGVTSCEEGSVVVNGRKTDPSCMQPITFSLLRIIEGVGMLLGLCGSENTRVAASIHRLKLLSPLLRAAELLLSSVELSLASLWDINESNTASARINKGDFRPHLTADTGSLISNCDALLHLILALYQLSASPSNTNFFGQHVVAVCVQIGWMVHDFLSKTASSHHTAFSSIQERFEILAMWSVELLCRLCCGERKNKLALDAARQQGVVGMLFAFSTYPVGHAELVVASLSTLNALTVGDGGCREQLRSEGGGLSSLVRGVVSAAEEAGRSLLHWHKLYLSLYALFGIITLPGEAAVLKRDGFLFHSVRSVPAEGLLMPYPHHNQQQQQQQQQGNVEVKEKECEKGCVDSGFSLPEAETVPLSLVQLPIDLVPDVFSPELRGIGCLDSSNTANRHPFIVPKSLLWSFSDYGPPLCHKVAVSSFSGADADEVEVELPRLVVSQSPQPLQSSSTEARIRIMKRLIERLCTSLHCMNRIIYERPPLVPAAEEQTMVDGVRLSESQHVSSTDALPCRCSESALPGFLKFRSDFESGNLQRAVAIDTWEYDLVLSPDTNTNCHVQWFYFSVEQYTPGSTYRFNILNMEKPGSTFNEGQRPLMLLVEGSQSSCKASNTQGWTRCGHDVFYYKNLYQRQARCTTTANATGKSGSKDKTLRKKASEKVTKGKCGRKKRARHHWEEETTYCYTLSFAVTFPKDKGRVFLANCFPYTYSNLMEDVRQWQLQASSSSVMLEVQQLCCTPGGIPVPILTLTGKYSSVGTDVNNHTCSSVNKDTSCGPSESVLTPVEQRPVCIVTARVHPGESNSSWMVRGLVSFLLRNEGQAHAFRSRFVWKIIPMMNPDGVVVGNHRCSLGGADLNRDYYDPKPRINPVIYSLKRLTRHIIEREQRCVALFADFHGHSRAKNFFIYGCTRSAEAQDGNVSLRMPSVPSVNTLVAVSASYVSNNGKNTSNSAASLGTTLACTEKLLPLVLAGLSPAFDMSQSSFTVKKSKRHTGRVVMCREFGIRMSYTLEATMVGGRGDIFEYHRDIIPSTSVIGGEKQQYVNENGKNGVQRHGAGDEKDKMERGKKAAESLLHEISYDTRHYESMGALLVRSLDVLLDGNGDGVDVMDKEAVERAWLQLFQGDGADTTPNVGSPLLGGSYAFASRRDRRMEDNRSRKEKAYAIVAPSLEQREEILRALFVRPRAPGAQRLVSAARVESGVAGGMLLGSDSDSDSDKYEDGGEDDGGDNGTMRMRCGVYESGNDDDDYDDNYDEDEDDDDEDDDDDGGDEEDEDLNDPNF